LFVKERQNSITKLLEEKKSVTTTELIQKLNVSDETIRRDLLALEKQGVLQRVHGGAMLTGNMKTYADLPHRIEENKKGKTELTEYAASLIDADDIIAIDVGSTAVYFAEALRDRLSALTVITNSLDVFNILQVKPNFNITLCGGSFSKEEMAFYGLITIETLKMLHVKKSFICPSAVSLAGGISDFNHALIETQQQLINCGDEVYILADSNKFETHAMYKICDISPQHHLITDSDINQNLIDLYKDNHINVLAGKKGK